MSHPDLDSAVLRYAQHSRAPGTRASYLQKMVPFRAFCAERGEQAVPAKPETVRLYLAKLAEDGLSVSTVNQFLSAIGEAHEAAGHLSPRFHPAVQQVWRGIRRTKKVRAVGMKPLLAEHIKKMLAATPDVSMLNARDRAIVTFGWACAMRRHEVVDTNVENVTFHDKGFTVLIERAKEDQEGNGFEKMVLNGKNPDTCPVRILKNWLTVSRITEGPIFRPVNRWGRVVQYGEQQRLWPQYVEKIVKRLMTNAGLDHKGYGAHSLRAGFITQAALNGHTESEIMRHSGHSNTKIVQRYIRIANLDKKNATEDMGL